MLKKLLVLPLIASMALGIGCATGFGPQGGIYTDTTLGIYGTDTSGSKTGEACAFSTLGLLAFGDGSVEEAAANGGISEIKQIDLKGFNILGIYASLCTVVTGD